MAVAVWRVPIVDGGATGCLEPGHGEGGRRIGHASAPLSSDHCDARPSPSPRFKRNKRSVVALTSH